MKRYELQTQADIAILRATLLRAQQLSLKGFANLSILEHQELAGAMNGLVSSVDKTLREVGETVKTVSGVAMPLDGMLDDNEDIRGVLDYISDSLSNTEFDQQDQQLEVDSRTRELALQTQLLTQPVREIRQTRPERSYDYEDQLKSLEQDPRQTQRLRASSRVRSRERDRDR